MNAPTRRTIVRGAAWTVPIIATMGVAPAFAASAPICRPTGCKGPGDGGNTKDYYLTPGCDQTVTTVWIDNELATRLEDGRWKVTGKGDSRRDRPVRIVATAGDWSGPVAFPPCETL